MRIHHRSVARVGLASVLGALATFGAARADAANAPCDPAALTCSLGSVALKAQIKDQLPTAIDSGLMDKGLIKVRTRFTINPVGSDPLFSIDMPKGATALPETPPANVRLVSPPAATLQALQAAASGQRRAETALLASIALGDANLAELHPAAVATIVQSLRAVGEDASARLFAIETAIAHGL